MSLHLIKAKGDWVMSEDLCFLIPSFCNMTRLKRLCSEQFSSFIVEYFSISLSLRVLDT